MTENKRFEIKPSAMYNNKYVIHDSKIEYTFPVLDSTLNYMFCKALNELHDENQLLHKINENAIDFMYDNFDLNIIFTDRELNDICNEMGWELSEKGIKINQLEKENEQLKQRIKELEQEIEKLDTFKKILEYAEKESDRVDWQSYCEKEFEGF